MKKQQTAVEYLVEQLIPTKEQYYHIEKAKQIEEEQIKKAYLQGDRNGFTRYRSVNIDQMTSEEYYNETYNNAGEVVRHTRIFPKK